MAKHGDQSRPTVKPRLGIEQIEWMFAHIFRSTDIADLAFASLRPELFHPGTEAHYQLLWQSALSIYQKQGAKAFTNPDYAYAVLEIEILSRVRSKADSLNPEFYDRLFSRNEKNPGILLWIFNQVKESELKLGWGKELLRDFRLEREVSDALAALIGGASGKVIVNLPDLLNKLTEKQVAISAQTTDRAVSGAPVGWTPPPMEKIKTGISYLDHFLRGGHAKGEAYGVLGAYGSGKTSLAIQIAQSGSMYQLSLGEKDPTYRPKDWFIFTYEATADECRTRLWAMACTVDHHKLEEFDWGKFTTGASGIDGLDPYEKKYFAHEIKQGVYLGEKERLERELPRFNVNFWIHDMTGTGDNPKKGTGYIQEIIALLKTDLNEMSRRDGWKHELGGVVIDYAGLCAKRYVSEHGVDLNHLRHFVGDFGYKCKTEIAVPFNCPVWVFHQLDTKANKKSMRSMSHHADAAEGKNFGENMVFCFELGTKDPTTNTLYMNCSKARRGQVGRSPLLQLEGRFFRIVEDQEHIVNSIGEVKPKKKAGVSVATSETQDSFADPAESSTINEEPKPFGLNQEFDKM